MEQKKTLWIVAAAGIFLLVVVGAALILYSPSLHQSSGMQAGFDPSTGWISSTKDNVTPVSDQMLSFNSETAATNDQNELSSLPASPFTNTDFSSTSETSGIAQNNDSTVRADKLTVISDNTTVYSSGTTTIDLNSLKSSSSATGMIAKNEMTANQINSNRSSQPTNTYEETAPVAESYYTPAPVTNPEPVAKARATPKAQPAAKAVAKATSAAPAKTEAKKVTSAKTASAPAASKATTAKKVAASAKKTPDSFWVQAAAYTSKRNADEARNTLESNKIPSEVFTFTDSNGKTFYRVRVGPYVTKSEAEYWQTRIGMIDKFASSKSVIVNTGNL